MMKKEADKLLIKLDEENYTKFKIITKIWS